MGPELCRRDPKLLYQKQVEATECNQSFKWNSILFYPVLKSYYLLPLMFVQSSATTATAAAAIIIIIKINKQY